MLGNLWFLVKLAALIAAAVWLAERPGTVAVDWLSYNVEMHIGFALLVALFALILILALHRLWLWLLSSGDRWRTNRRLTRQNKGVRALTLGLGALSTGDAKHARYQAHRARTLLANDNGLAVLLEAQAARLRGAHDEATEHYQTLLRNKDTAMIGLRGLLITALDRDDPEQALRLAGEARKIAPKQPWVLQTLYRLQLQTALWNDAETTLRHMVKQKVIDSHSAESDRVALFVEQADRALQAHQKSEAENYLKRALKTNPAFIPAAQRLARLYIEGGRTRKARKIIEKTWKTNPHPALKDLWGRLAPETKPSDPGRRLRWFEKLVSFKPDSAEGQMAAAEAAIESRLWGEAEQYLEMAESLRTTARLYRLYATMAEKRGQSEQAKHWLRQAAEARPGKVWICRRTGHIYEDWHAIAAPHGAFNTIIWADPDDVKIVDQPAVRLFDTGTFDTGKDAILLPTTAG